MPDSVQRWRCDCAYDGTEFSGWQKQPSKLAVQDFIEKALEEIFHHPVKTVGAGRTDAGVHAKNQVFHFDKDWKHGEESMIQAMRSHLPKGNQSSKNSKSGTPLSCSYFGKRKEIPLSYDKGVGNASG